jgi:hypothetical protein
VIRGLLLVVAIAAWLVSSIGATSAPTYALVSLSATVHDDQVTHEGPGEDGAGASTVALVTLTRPRLAITATPSTRTVTIRVKGSGDAQASFNFAGGVGSPPRRVECASPVLTRAQSTATFVAGKRTVQVRLTLPYVQAPFVEASDLYPDSGPCDVRGRTLVVTRTFPAALVARRPVTLTLAGTKATNDGDIVYTTTWRASLTLARQ